jgi:hypothetical protein
MKDITATATHSSTKKKTNTTKQAGPSETSFPVFAGVAPVFDEAEESVLTVDT